MDRPGYPKTDRISICVPSDEVGFRLFDSNPGPLACRASDLKRNDHLNQLAIAVKPQPLIYRPMLTLVTIINSQVKYLI